MHLDSVPGVSVMHLAFPVGEGSDPIRRAPTSNAGTFRQKRMSKVKNLLRFGDRAPPTPPVVTNGSLVYL